MEQLPFDRLARIRLSEQLASRIESLILGSQLMPEDKLPSERELGEQFGVSRTAVREALKLLEERGLVEVRSGRGAFVVQPGLDSLTSALRVALQRQHCTLGHLDEARRCLEAYIAGLAARNALPADIARMEAAVEAMEENLERAQAFVEADFEFHAAVAAATQNPLLGILTYPLTVLTQKTRPIAFSALPASMRNEHHKRLLERIRSRDILGAEQAVLQILDEWKQAVKSAGMERDPDLLIRHEVPGPRGEQLTRGVAFTDGQG
jgi:GntR family transcriptional regulator, transcriptional repressor for pyruvate dehydrogenase complex